MTGASLRASALILPGAGTEAAERTARSIPDAQIVLVPDSSAQAVRGAFERAQGDLVMILRGGDVPAPEYLARAGAAIEAGADLVYADEDRLVDGVRVDPWYKPGWSPDRFRCQQYMGGGAVIRRAAVVDVGGVDEGAGAAFEWDLLLRVTERSSAVAHLPRVLLHRDGASGDDDPRSDASEREAARRVVERHLRRTGVPATVAAEGDGPFRLRPDLDECPLVSIVIPTAGTGRRIHGRHVTLVEHCVRSIAEQSTYPNFEVVCVTDGDCEPAVVDAVERAGRGSVRWLTTDAPFNFSHRVNLGVLDARGELVLLLNDDTEVLTEDWIEHLALYAADPTVGAVGAHLYFEDGRLQHAGVAMVDGNPGHPYYGFPARWRGYHDQLLVPANMLAVTGACIMVRRGHYLDIGGLSHALPLNYNDVDFCLKLHVAGLRNVCTPEVRLAHYESSSRGAGEVESSELAMLHSRWGTILDDDPYYSPNFLPTADYVALASMDGRTPAELGLR